MADLRSRTPLAGLAPVRIGTSTLSEVPPAPVHAILPYAGQVAATSDALRELIGLEFPEPGNAAAAAGDLRLLWAGRAQALAVGDLPSGTQARLAPHAAVIDVSDAWAVVHLSGAQTEDVLARLTPLDLRAGSFGVGCTARTELAHMAVLLVRRPSGVEIWAMRSMAVTVHHDLSRAMAAVAARGTTGP